MRYRVLQPISLPKGTLLGLTEAQAAARSFALRPTLDGLWQVAREVQFKAGETVEAPDLPKRVRHLVTPLAAVAAAVAPARPKRRADAESPAG
jgi:hypothetical protein